MKAMKSKGPKTEPWGTPVRISLLVDLLTSCDSFHVCSWSSEIFWSVCPPSSSQTISNLPTRPDKTGSDKLIISASAGESMLSVVLNPDYELTKPRGKAHYIPGYLDGRCSGRKCPIQETPNILTKIWEASPLRGQHSRLQGWRSTRTENKRGLNPYCPSSPIN